VRGWSKLIWDSLSTFHQQVIQNICIAHNVIDGVRSEGRIEESEEWAHDRVVLEAVNINYSDQTLDLGAASDLEVLGGYCQVNYFLAEKWVFWCGV